MTTPITDSYDIAIPAGGVLVRGNREQCERSRLEWDGRNYCNPTGLVRVLFREILFKDIKLRLKDLVQKRALAVTPEAQVFWMIQVMTLVSRALDATNIVTEFQDNPWHSKDAATVIPTVHRWVNFKPPRAPGALVTLPAIPALMHPAFVKLPITATVWKKGQSSTFGSGGVGVAPPFDPLLGDFSPAYLNSPVQYTDAMRAKFGAGVVNWDKSRFLIEHFRLHPRGYHLVNSVSGNLAFGVSSGLVAGAQEQMDYAQAWAQYITDADFMTLVTRGMSRWLDHLQPLIADGTINLPPEALRAISTAKNKMGVYEAGAYTQLAVSTAGLVSMAILPVIGPAIAGAVNSIIGIVVDLWPGHPRCPIFTPLRRQITNCDYKAVMAYAAQQAAPPQSTVLTRAVKVAANQGKAVSTFDTSTVKDPSGAIANVAGAVAGVATGVLLTWLLVRL